MQINFFTRLRYRFEHSLSTGVTSVIIWLMIFTIFCGVFAAIVLTLSGTTGLEDEELPLDHAIWDTITQAFDPSGMPWSSPLGYKIVMTFMELLGIIVVSILIGLITTGISDMIENLRRGRSHVIEKNHTVVYGWSSKIFQILQELVTANENKKNPSIVILADKDKVEMENEIKEKIEDRKNSEIICRTGSIIDIDDVNIVNPQSARSIIILPGEDEHSDINVIKSLMAILNNPKRKKEPYHIVTEVNDLSYVEVANIIGRKEVSIVQTNDLIARITVQTTRQPGLSTIYTELLNFHGVEFYFKEQKELIGKTYREALFCYADSSVVGLKSADGTVMLNPSNETIIPAGTQIIALSLDDDTLTYNPARNYSIQEAEISSENKSLSQQARTLLLGWNSKAPIIISELDKYLLPGSEITIVSESDKTEEAINAIKDRIVNQKITYIRGDIADKKLLLEIQPQTFSNIMIVCYSNDLGVQEADAKTLVTLIHLRHMATQLNTNFNIVSEMLDIRNKALAEIAKPDDFIISDNITSLLLSTISDNLELRLLLEDLFSAEGNEIYLKPASNYVKPGKEVNFYTIVEAAARKNETAIGFRQQKYSTDKEKNFGIRLNPDKSSMIKPETGDTIIVIAGS
jgi:ion channel POLLUX/CASTOR